MYASDEDVAKETDYYLVIFKPIFIEIYVINVEDSTGYLLDLSSFTGGS